MQVETDLGQLMRLFEAVLASVGDPLLIFDSTWTLLQANNAARALFAIETDQAPLEDVLGDSALARALRDHAVPKEWHHGEEGYYLPRLTMFTDEAEQASRYVVVLRDVTAIKRLNQNQNEFVHIVSHDLRSPLTTIKGYTGMLGMDSALTSKQKEYTDKVMSGIHQLTSLVDNIQDAGRFDIETGFYVMQREQCDVTEIVARVVGGCVVPAEKQDLKLSVDVAPDVPIINADINMIERALTNLVDNAIKYTPNGGTIIVSVRRGHERLELRVSDNGLGIAPEDQKKLFQRHSRINREEYRRVKGTGLGLFIVRSVAQRHGGDAWVESTIGVGSTFAFYIPLQGANLIFGSGLSDTN
ncbi:MAG: HAMP domain-containing sensor histidine kinase [Chloroflexota bacterium]|nr:HAMP domain-containing sensor histidine kinase [Chloroflexota bacterium]